MDTLRIAFDGDLRRHDTGQGFAESPARLDAVEQALACVPEVTRIAAEPITDEEICRVHAPEYIPRVTKACETGARFVDEQDVVICPESFVLARQAAGYVVEMTRQIMRGETLRGFCGIRPPGHHAERNRAMGFCLLNNIGLAAQTAREEFGLERVAILDWDVHHGNGTQHIFDADPGVLFISLHEHPSYQYPGTGYAEEVGVGEGAGTTINIPLMPGTGDDAFEGAFQELILPRIDEYRPELLLISAGFDAHADDPLGHLELSDEIFVWMLERLLEKAEQHTQGRLLSVLEGGYDLDALQRCVGEHVARLAVRA